MKGILKTSGIYIISTAVSGITPILLIPILTSYLSPTEYGNLSMFTILSAAMTSVMGFGTVGAANRKYFDNKSDFEIIKSYNSACFTILLYSILMIIPVVVYIYNVGYVYLDIPPEWALYCFLIGIFTFVVNFRLGQWQIRGIAWKYACVQVGQSLLVFIITFLLIKQGEYREEVRVYAGVITSIIVGTIAIFLLAKERLLSCKANKEQILEALSFGLPLLPHILGGLVINTFDRYYIGLYLGKESLGYYSLGISIALIMSMFFHSINKAYSPWVFKKLSMDNQDSNVQVVKNCYQLFIFLIFISLMIYLLGPWVFKLIIDDKFNQSIPIVIILMISQVFLGAYLVVTNIVFYSKRTKYIAISTLTCGIVNVALLLILTPIFNLQGAAYSSLLSNMFLFILTWYIAIKVHRLPWASRKVFEIETD
ncbi:lipopolysaccharide biosynthesis protein [Vibrio sp. 10N.247.311.14]|uniref:lipopolysaccharide biosynthesis protein n=1 Tax=Vibrio sp. 10N.247.311.14 TaxID=3229994 RepID=UPI003550168A